MIGRLAEIKKNSKIWTARALIMVMLSLSATWLYPIQTSASQTYPQDAGDIWEELENGGEVMTAFPSQIEAAISSPDDIDCYSFRLEEKTSLTLSLESEFACAMELMQQGQVIGISSRPYSQILEPDGLEAGTYTVRITSQEHVEKSIYILRISRQSDRKKQPDYSEAHMAGTLFDPKSPFRSINIQSEEEKNRGGGPIMAIHYLAHWQGPVDESVMPYYDKGDYQETPSDYIKYKKAKPNFHLQNAILLPGFQEDGGHIQHWKNAIMTYGAVDTGFNTSACYGDKNEGPGLPDWDLAYYFVPKDWQHLNFGGHATLIVGWDDTVEKEHFRITRRDDEGNVIAQAMPEQDGAWICKDSYGGRPPEYFYASYESRDFGTIAYSPTAFAPPEQNDNYNHLYSNSPGGMMDAATAARGFLRAVQVYKNGGQEELLRAVGFVAAQGEISYEIGIRVGDGPLERVKTGYLKYPGFYTARLDQGIMIPPGSDFEIHVALSGDENQLIHFYTYQNVDGWINGVKAIPGKSYYFTDWDDQTSGMDASAEGEYPYILAYTYAPLKQEITILDNKEAAATATASEAVREIKKAPEDATPSQATHKYHTATSSDASEEDQDYGEEQEDNLLIADEDELDFWRIRSQDSGAIPYENAEDIEVNPLNMQFPPRYDSRDYHLITKVKNQGNSNLCWAFAAVGALETSYLRYGNQMIDYPRGLNLISQAAPITDGTITLKLKKGEELPLDLSAALYSDSGQFKPGSPQICWELSGDLASVEGGRQLSENGETVCALKALAPGRVTVTAVSMADISLKASCQVEIVEMIPARVHIEPETLTMAVGEVRKLKTTVKSDEELAVVYSSDRPDVVSVDKNGQVMALKPGTAVITAKAGEGEAVCTITVSGRSTSDDSGGGGDWIAEPGPGMADTLRGTWKQDAGQWRFMKNDGSYVNSSWQCIAGVWYYFKEDGYVASGWFRQGDIWYYLSQDPATYGGMQKGWLYDPSYQGWFYLEESGAMAVGWKQINRKWYYFHTISDGEKGKMDFPRV